MTTTYTGQGMKRMEDDRLLRGAGRFVADVKRAGTLHMAVVRSTEPHALVKGIDIAEASGMNGVVGVYTSADFPGLPLLEIMRRPNMDTAYGAEHPLLALDRVLYVGQPVAFVVAATLEQAEDAAEQVAVEYEPLLAQIDPRAVESKPLHPGLRDNIVIRTNVDAGDVEAEFAKADAIVQGTYRVPRVSPAPMEGRGCIAWPDEGDGRLHVVTSTQASHEAKTSYLHLLGDHAPDLHVVSLDVGGGFGQKHHVYPDEAGVVLLAHRLGRPVRWIESRRENMIASHARGYEGDLEAAVRKDGRILAMRVRAVADLGAYQIHGSFISPEIVGRRMTGPYDIKNLEMRLVGVMTNKPPMGPYRGAGQPEASIMMERLIDQIADELGVDPVEVRRLNLIRPDQFPYHTAGGLVIDSGNYQAAFAKALEVADYADWKARQPADRKLPDGRLLGIGMATTASGSGGSGGAAARSSYARITIDANGHVTLDSDVSPHGQGMATSFAQLVADRLGVEPSDVTMRTGDTDLSKPVGPGAGTYASRSLVIGGSAAHEAAEKTRDLLDSVAAAALECELGTVRIEKGVVWSAADPSRHMSIGQLAMLAQQDREPTATGALEVEHVFTLPNSAFSFTSHIAIVEVDSGTGAIDIKKFVAVHDAGTAVNPLIVQGQIAGGVAQGLGQALMEAVDHEESGMPTAISFMDYGIPHAGDMPHIDTALLETATSLTPTGMRGMGESPAVASPPALANAVVDALSAMGVRHIDLPLTPERVWSAIHSAR